MSGASTMKMSVLVQPADDDRAPAGLRHRRAGVAADERVRRARGQAVVPRDQVPDDRAHQPGKDHREADDRDVDEAGADGLGDRRAEGERGDEVEERRPDDGLARRQHPRRHDGGDRVGGVVKAVDEVENERDDDQRDDCEKVGIHPRGQACLTTTPSSTLATSSQRSVAASRKSRISFHLMIVDRVLLFLEQAADRVLVRAIGLVLEAIDLDRRLGDAMAPLERLHRDHHLLARGGDEARELARVGPHALDLVEPDDGGRGVDRVHDVVEDARERVDVFAIERRDERAMQALDDLVGDEVALVLDFLDLVGLVPDRPLGREHLLEERRALLNLLGERDEIVEEPLFARNESECHESLLPASSRTLTASRES